MTTMDDDLAAMLGLPPKPRIGRPPKYEPLPPSPHVRDVPTHPTTFRKAALPEASPADNAPIPTRWTDDMFEDDHPDVQKLLSGGMVDESAFFRPVGVSFLATVFGTEPRRMHKKLARCPVVGRGTHGRGSGQPLYDFKTAVSYCVEPRIDLKTWFSSLSTTTMPPIIAKAFWDAMRAKNKAMEESGHYWHSEDVLRLLGDVFMEIKDTTLLWIEELPSKATLSTEDYHALRRLVNELVKDVQARLIEMPTRSRTDSVVAALERDIAEGNLDRLNGGEWEE